MSQNQVCETCLSQIHEGKCPNPFCPTNHQGGKKQPNLVTMLDPKKFKVTEVQGRGERPK